jgi:hypothetical protein
MIDIVEEKPQRYYLCYTEDTCREILGVYKLTSKECHGEVTEIEYVCSPIETQYYREYSTDRKHNPINCSMIPRFGDRLFLEVVTCRIGLVPIAETGYGEYAGELHNPPYQNLDRE